MYMTDQTGQQMSKFVDVNLEAARFEFDKWKTKKELALKEYELKKIRKAESRKSAWSSPLLLAVVGLVASVIVSIVQNASQSSATRNLEQRKFESSLIQKALETDDQSLAARRLRRLLDLQLIEDKQGIILGWLKNPETIPLDRPEESFVGVDRRAAKLSIGTGTMETFPSVFALIASLPPDAQMSSRSISSDAQSARVVEEQRNVRIRARIYAASRETDNDFHLIIGDDAKTGKQVYLTAEVSGLPPVSSRSFETLKSTRSDFEQYFDKSVPGAGYDFYDPPIPVEIEGSLFYDVLHASGPKAGPHSLKSQIPTAWEIHPITHISFGP